MKKTPLRMCVGCREMKPKAELVRVVKSPEGTVSLDTTFKAQGRGAYVCKSPDCIKKIEKTRALNRAFKMAIPEEVYDKLGI